jgi:hypothetical protein
VSNINERSRAGATEQILREQNQHLRGERDRLEEQLAEAVRLLNEAKPSCGPVVQYLIARWLDQNSNPTP